MSSFNLTKGKSIFIIDALLFPIFLLVIYTGIKLHTVGHLYESDHEAWSMWAHSHIIISALSILGFYLHIKAHWGWYKRIFSKGIGSKSKTTAILSFLYLILLFTGIQLALFIDESDSPVGLWHYKLGLLMSVLLLVHFITRFSTLKKGLFIRKKG
ncbi:MAG: DUF4405 domain-containing protein [Tannerellaceae bacterium]